MRSLISEDHPLKRGLDIALSVIEEWVDNFTRRYSELGNIDYIISVGGEGASVYKQDLLGKIIYKEPNKIRNSHIEVAFANSYVSFIIRKDAKRKEREINEKINEKLSNENNINIKLHVGYIGRVLYKPYVIYNIDPRVSYIVRIEETNGHISKIINNITSNNHPLSSYSLFNLPKNVEESHMNKMRTYLLIMLERAKDKISKRIRHGFITISNLNDYISAWSSYMVFKVENILVHGGIAIDIICTNEKYKKFKETPYMCKLSHLINKRWESYIESRDSKWLKIYIHSKNSKKDGVVL